LMLLLRKLVNELDNQIQREKDKIANEEMLSPEFAAQVADLEAKVPPALSVCGCALTTALGADRGAPSRRRGRRREW
jgi:hypothetical protein